MALSAGTRLGPYEVVDLLGAGGMGEVYRARDTRLGRDVALKVLPTRFAESPARLARLGREARLLAALNHPHIATLYGFEEGGGTPALVMELVEGATLAARLERGPLPLEEALELARQIAEALEAAHEKGILHRDLKPANVRLTEKGQVKLLDFGLAKALRPAEEEPAPTHPPSTLTTEESPVSPATGVAGTAPYMSPEQARGEEVDRRSDLWAFGCVLYEMLTGRRAFPGRTFGETVAAVLEREPEWGALPGGMPPAVARLLERCLRKGREERLRDAGDARLELEELLVRRPGRGRRELEERSPYPGLRAFAEEDAGYFFGREREIAELWGKLRERKLVAVIGPSGAGKTSFLRAGVIAARPQGWGAVYATPGANAVLGLARALTPELANDAEGIGELLSGVAEPSQAGGVARLVSVAKRWRARHAEVLLVVDQLEELFTLNPPETQVHFAALLGRLVTEADVHVVLSLRDDFLMRCHEQEALRLVFAAIAPLGALTREGLRRALVEPAARRGYRVEDETLVEEMVGAVEGTRGALPLVAFAVSRLWERRERERKLLTRQAYEEIGGVAGALAQHAEATLEAIGPERQALVREMFRNLVTAQGTRAAMEREELLSAFPEREMAEEVLDRLIDARLLTPYEVEGREGEPSHHRVEIVHESLLTSWPRLVRWQAQDEEGALLRDQLKQAAHLWDDKGRTADLLWTGTAYREYELWRERYTGQLTSLEDDFARAMAGKARRRKRLATAAVAFVIVALAGVAIAIGISRQQAARARDQARVEAAHSEAGRLVSLGRLRLADSPTAALAYATASIERIDNEPARRLAVEALWEGPPVVFLNDAVEYESLKWSPDGRWLGIGGLAAAAILDRDGKKVRALKSSAEWPLGFTADGRRLVTWDQTATTRAVLHVWALPEWSLERTLEQPDPSSSIVLVNDRLLTFAFGGAPPRGDAPAVVRRLSLDGKEEEARGRWEPHGLGDFDVDPAGERIYSLEQGRLLERWLDRLSAPPRVLGAHAGTKVSVASRPWRDRVVTADNGGEVRIWDVRSARLERTLKSPADARFVALDPTGRFVVVAPPDPLTPRSVRLFDLAAPRTAEPVPLLGDERPGNVGTWFSPDGSWFALGTGRSFVLWSVAGARTTVVGRQNKARVTFAPDGDLLSVSLEGVLMRWPLSPSDRQGARVLWKSVGRAPYFLHIEVDSRGRFVVAASRSNEIAVVPLDGSKPFVHHLRKPDDVEILVICGLKSLDAGGRFLAASLWGWTRHDPNSIRILDLATGNERILDTHPKGDERCLQAASQYEGTATPVWLRDGRLVTDGDGGLRVWDVGAGTSERLRPCRLPIVQGKANLEDPGRLLATPDSRTVLRLDWAKNTGDTSSLTAFDLTSRATREIASHGNQLLSFALDRSGTILVTGDRNGVVRVGRVSGEEPHLLFGHAAPVESVAVSPDGRRIASAGDDGTLRVWPMPDLSKPPLQTWPRDQLLAKLRSLTNLRVVRDPSSETGWKTDVGPFPGWKDVPTW